LSKIQEKWRESLIDINEIKFKDIILDKIISYPPAGNDVFECVGKYKNSDTEFVIKSERSKFANFKNEIKVLDSLSGLIPIPKLIESGNVDGHTYIVMSKLYGDKLSDIFREQKNVNKDKYLFIYGKTLAKIHDLDINWDKAMQRDINDVPSNDIYSNLDEWETFVIEYLKKNKPTSINYDTFIHGDFHYGNILWNDYKITGILDFEYAGIGFKEQDIAWALILRPGQEFMDNKHDRDLFLEGYKSICMYDENKLNWCLINGTMHFYLMNKKNEDNKYLNKLKEIINDLIL